MGASRLLVLCAALAHAPWRVVACSCLAEAKPQPGFDICPGEQLKMMHAQTLAECCEFCQHTDGTPLVPGTEHWVMNREADPNTGNNCYCKKCPAGSAPTPSPNSLALAPVTAVCSDWGWSFVLTIGVVSGLYVAGGSGWQYKTAGKVGLPHAELWQQVTGLVAVRGRHRIAYRQTTASILKLALRHANASGSLRCSRTAQALRWVGSNAPAPKEVVDTPR